jgi:hypothetical protein
MPGLVPGIHALTREEEGVDGRDKPGHDDATPVVMRETILQQFASPSFLLTRYLPPCSNRRLPSFSM